MRYIKLLRFDLYECILKKHKQYIIISILVLIPFFDLLLISFRAGICFTLGDYLMYVFGGAHKYIYDPQNPFEPPYFWLLFHLLILYFSLSFAPHDLSETGQQILYRFKSRQAWWLSKCFWLVVSVIIYYVASLTMLFLISLITGINMSMNVTNDIFLYLSPGTDYILTESSSFIAELVIMPMLFSVSYALMQLTLSLFTKPAYAYIVPVCLCLMATHTQTFLLFGNYSMAIRSNKVIRDGMNTSQGIVLMVLLSTFCVVLGIIRFRKYDILNKDD